MNVEVNGTARELPDGITLDVLIQTLASSTRGSAAAVDGEVIPRSAWPGFAVREGNSIELITAVQGG